MQKPSLRSRRSFIRALSGVALGSAVFTGKYAWDVFGNGHESPPVEAQKAVSHVSSSLITPAPRMCGGDDMWIMFTGITTPEDGVIAAKYANAVGLVVASGGRSGTGFISQDEAKAIQKQLPENCEGVLVTHSTDWEEIVSLVRYIRVQTIALYGKVGNQIDPDHVMAIRRKLLAVARIELRHTKIFMGIPVINYTETKELVRKYMNVVRANAVDAPDKYMSIVHAIEFDTPSYGHGQIGGTGREHSGLDICARIVKEFGNIRVQSVTSEQVGDDRLQFMMAGGLNDQNVGNVISTVQPYGVDVSSYVKEDDGSGRLDEIKAEKFAYAARKQYPIKPYPEPW